MDAMMIEAVTGLGAFGRLPEQDLRGLVQQSTIRSLRARETIFRCGDPGRTVIVVLDGYVKLSSFTPGGREVVLEIVQPGGCFGELAVLNNWPRNADASTISRCKLLAIDGRQFIQVMERSPAGLQVMVQLISQRLRTVNERVIDAIELPASARLVKVLLHLAELQCPTVRNGTRIQLRLSQAELGGMTGLTRESINKHLAMLRDAGWILQSCGSVTLLDVTALASLLQDHEGHVT